MTTSGGDVLVLYAVINVLEKRISLVRLEGVAGSTVPIKSLAPKVKALAGPATNNAHTRHATTRRNLFMVVTSSSVMKPFDN
jgi:hypothetical protein